MPVVVWKICICPASGRRGGQTREHETSPKAFRDIRYIGHPVTPLQNSNALSGRAGWSNHGRTDDGHRTVQISLSLSLSRPSRFHLKSVTYRAQGLAKRPSQGLVNFASALADHFCLALQAVFTQPGDHLKPVTYSPRPSLAG